MIGVRAVEFRKAFLQCQEEAVLRYWFTSKLFTGSAGGTPALPVKSLKVNGAGQAFDAAAPMSAEYARVAGIFEGNKECRRLVCGINKEGVPGRMSFTKEEAIERARIDLAKRLGSGAGEIKEDSVEDVDFPDMALGAAGNGEMSGQMMTSGWRIRLSANGERFEYRANRSQVRLFNYQGANYKV